MFLDERLLERCKQSDIQDDFEKTALLTRDLFSMCDEYYKKQFKEAKATTGKEMKVILDRTFNFFDLFVRNALKSEDENLQICGKIFQEYSYKTAFLEDPEIRAIYERISK